jgi:hypothetical protein
MTDQPQGPGWWQASDRKWYPPAQHANPVTPASPPPPPGLPPSPHQQGPWPLPGGGPPKKSLNPKVIAAGIGAVALLAVAGMCGHTNTSSPGDQNSGGTSGKGNQDSPAGDQDPTAGHTKSYQTGYWWAYNYSKGNAAYGPLLAGPSTFCANSATGEAPVQGLNSREWTQGCEDALGKLGYDKTPTPTVATSYPPECSDRTYQVEHSNCPPLPR